MKQFLRPNRTTGIIFVTLFIIPFAAFFTGIFVVAFDAAYLVFGILVALALVLPLYVALFIGLLAYLGLLYVAASFLSWAWRQLSKQSKKTRYVILTLIVLVAGGVYFLQNPRSDAYTLLPIDESGCFPFRLYANVPIYRQQQGELSLPQELIINSQTEYDQLLQFRRYTSTPQDCSIKTGVNKDVCLLDQKCMQISLPTVDFSTNTVLGNYSSGSCAAYGFERVYLRDDSTKTITYTVKPKTRWISCSGPGKHSLNLIAVPKIPSDYSVVFKPDKSASQDSYREYRTNPQNPKEYIIYDTYGKEVERKSRIDCMSQKITEFILKDSKASIDEGVRVCSDAEEQEYF